MNVNYCEIPSFRIWNIIVRIKKRYQKHNKKYNNHYLFYSEVRKDFTNFTLFFIHLFDNIIIPKKLTFFIIFVLFRLSLRLFFRHKLGVSNIMNRSRIFNFMGFMGFMSFMRSFLHSLGLFPLKLTSLFLFSHIFLHFLSLLLFFNLGSLASSFVYFYNSYYSY